MFATWLTSLFGVTAVQAATPWGILTMGLINIINSFVGNIWGIGLSSEILTELNTFFLTLIGMVFHSNLTATQQAATVAAQTPTVVKVGTSPVITGGQTSGQTGTIDDFNTSSNG